MSTPDPEAPDPTSREPAMKAGGVTAAVGAALWLAIEFGAKLTAGQQAAILGAAVILFPLLQAVWTRRHVWSPATVAKLLRGEDL
jgi:hypothetical protein